MSARLQFDTGSGNVRKLAWRRRRLEADALAAALGPEPWDEPVDGDALLDGLVTTFQRYIVMELPGLQTLALWSVHTYCFQRWQNTPRLHIRSPKRRSGKSRVRDVLACTAAKPIVAEGVTAAVVFRLTEDRQPTWLIDEIDQWLDPKGELVGIFNSGHAKGGQALRCVGDEHRVQEFSVYAPLTSNTTGRSEQRSGTSPKAKSKNPSGQKNSTTWRIASAPLRTRVICVRSRRSLIEAVSATARRSLALGMPTKPQAARQGRCLSGGLDRGTLGSPRLVPHPHATH